MVDVSVVIPTRDRAPVLEWTLQGLCAQETSASFEVFVVDDGSTDETRAVVEALGRRAPIPVSLLRQDGAGPAAARNRGIASAEAPVCLFVDDDTRPRVDLVERHARFHRRRPEPEAALVGRVEWAPETRPTPFMHWLHTGIQFDFAQIRDPDDVPGSCFYTANVSAKTAFLRVHGGFDEAFPAASFEDIELGLRLREVGMRLRYDADAVVDHWHPVDLAFVLRRMRVAGRSAVLLHERFPDWPLPRPPGIRHRAKATILSALGAVPHQPWRLRRATWHFLCHEAFREGCWGAEPADGELVRIGRRLARRAARDPATAKPRSEPPGP